MAAGILEKIVLTPLINNVVYIAPAGGIASVKVVLLNYDNESASADIIVNQGGTPVIEDYVEYSAGVKSNGGKLITYEMLLSPGDMITINTDGVKMTCRVSGIDGGSQSASMPLEG